MENFSFSNRKAHRTNHNRYDGTKDCIKNRRMKMGLNAKSGIRSRELLPMYFGEK